MDETSIQTLRATLAAEVQRSRERKSADFPAIPKLPIARYVDPEYYALERQHLWPKSWLLAGHMGEFAQIGSYKIWDQIGTPILLVRSGEDEVRAFYNVCRHRGGSLVPEACGTAKAFTCLFHGWTFALDGTLKGIPGEHEFPGVDKADHGLLPVRCERWGNLVFINQDPLATPYLEQLDPRLVREMADYDLDQRVVYHVARYNIPTNWKYVLDAFLEDYHAAKVHAGTVARALHIGGQSIEFFEQGTARMGSKMADLGQAQATNPMLKVALAADPRHALGREAFVSYNFFPNLASSMAETNFAIFAFWPKGPLESLVEIYFVTKPENGVIDTERCNTFLQEFTPVMDEDLGNLVRLSAGLNSGVLGALTLGYMERRIHQVHAEIDRRIGLEKIPERFKVPTMDAR